MRNWTLRHAGNDVLPHYGAGSGCRRGVQSRSVALQAATNHRRLDILLEHVDFPEVSVRVAGPELVLPGVAADGAFLVLSADAGRRQPLRRALHFLLAGDTEA